MRTINSHGGGGRVPRGRRRPTLIGVLAFDDATEGAAYSFSIADLFQGVVTEYAIETGAMGDSDIAFDTATGVFSSASVVGTVDLTGISVSATNAYWKSTISNTDTLTLNAA